MKAFLVANEALVTALKHTPAAVVIGVVLEDGSGFVMHANQPPGDKRSLDWLLAEFQDAQKQGWPGEPLGVDRCDAS